MFRKKYLFVTPNLQTNFFFFNFFSKHSIQVTIFHAMKAELPWHVQNCHLNWVLFFMGGQNLYLQNFELWSQWWIIWKMSPKTLKKVKLGEFQME